MYEITKWFLIIKVESHSDFFRVYDKAMQKIPDSALNKKWYRSINRTFVGQENGKFKHIIPLNQPTLKKIMENKKEVMKMPKQIIEHIHCPVNGWDCPYYTDNNHPCRCTLANPMEDCDDFATMWEEGDDYIDDDWEIDPDAELEKLMIENADVLKRLKEC